jgi:nucleotide-binding universal stress UspA family protein
VFKRILYPTDFSDCAEAALPYLKKLKGSGAAEIVVLHVVDARYTGFTETVSWFGESMKQYEMELFNNLKVDAERRIEKVSRALAKYFKVRIIVESGVPFKTIIDVARREKATLIVIGSHGKSNIAEMLLGSVSEKVIRKSPVPCLVVKR